ncbi:YHS domain-containing (seleno)protein [Hyphomonas sp. FCG-A18]|uniref:YHS domain-containing (seleno)protein n=1 Tax=Hyphomonas sp. FCG-A18 TaxID=3080019 RepID=UPI002B2817CD|nr:YHS domain-containing (seleno)protein [Hyphomonas sp. FCG-A18]
MKLRTLLVATALTITPVVIATPAAFADKDPVYTGRFSNTAVEGHDAVAYFTQGKPVKGSKDFSTEYQGAEFRFASAENLETFKADPAKYAPQYGGYCAWAVSQGMTAKGDANHWAIVDGKLYLNYNKKIQNTWNEDRASFIVKADAEWPNVLTK